MTFSAKALAKQRLFPHVQNLPIITLDNSPDAVAGYDQELVLRDNGHLLDVWQGRDHLLLW